MSEGEGGSKRSEGEGVILSSTTRAHTSHSDTRARTHALLATCARLFILRTDTHISLTSRHQTLALTDHPSLFPVEFYILSFSHTYSINDSVSRRTKLRKKEGKGSHAAYLQREGDAGCRSDGRAKQSLSSSFYQTASCLLRDGESGLDGRESPKGPQSQVTRKGHLRRRDDRRCTH